MTSTIKCVLKNIRIVYPKLFAPDEFMGKKRYSVGLLLPKDSDALAQVKEAITEACKAQFGDKAAEKIKSFQGSKQSWCLKQFDDETMLITPKRAYDRGAPAVLDQHCADLPPESGAIYGGCYVNCSFVISAYNKNGAQGVTAFLNGVQLVRDGEPLSGAGSAASCKADFEDLGATGAKSEQAPADIW